MGVSPPCGARRAAPMGSPRGSRLRSQPFRKINLTKKRFETSFQDSCHSIDLHLQGSPSATYSDYQWSCNVITEWDPRESGISLGLLTLGTGCLTRWGQGTSLPGNFPRIMQTLRGNNRLCFVHLLSRANDSWLQGRRSF